MRGLSVENRPQSDGVLRGACLLCVAQGKDGFVSVTNPAVAEMTAALEFYARPAAYRGSNQKNDGSDKFTPPDAPYAQDVLRDTGEVSRQALSKATP